MDAINRSPAEKLELHYFFEDESHFMNAFIRNKCEADLLAIAKEVAEYRRDEIVDSIWAGIVRFY